MTLSSSVEPQQPSEIHPRRVLIITGDPLGEKLAGPAIRAINFATQLSLDSHEVRVVSLQEAVMQSSQFQVQAVATQRDMARCESWAEIIVVQGNALVLYPFLAKTTKYLVVDVYDPMHLEQLEQGRGLSYADWSQAILGANAILNHQLRVGDFFLAASDRQLSFWLGALASLGRVNARTYRQDLTLRSLIDIVPFGLEAELPESRKPVLRGILPGITESSQLLVWAGGIYNWFDPETLVRAIGIVAIDHPEICLFFMGTRHPHPGVPEMEVIARTRELAATLGLTGKHVFFNDSWVDYSERHNYLLEANAGVSTHFEHIETVFSFRTRILDYLWAGLPIISTRGDSFAELIETRGLGATVPEQDVAALAAAIKKVLFEPTAGRAMKEAVAETRMDFTWRAATAPLRAFCADPRYAADRIDFTATGKIRRPIHVRRSMVTLRRIERAWGILVSDGPRGLIRAIRRPQH